jgi:hypothetical protein
MSRPTFFPVKALDYGRSGAGWLFGPCLSGRPQKIHVFALGIKPTIKSALENKHDHCGFLKLLRQVGTMKNTV